MTTASAGRTAAPFPLFRLLVLAGAIFVSVSSEFLPTGLLPDIAADLDVSESRVGLLVSVFAGTVALTSIPVTLLTRHVSRKGLLVITLGVFAVTNLAAAVAPSYEALMAARIVGGLAHGLFWAVAGPYTALLVAPGQLARAVSVTTGGGSLAFILGVPFTAAIGHALGWRLAFAVMAVIIVVFTVLVVLALPNLDHRVTLATGEIELPYHRDRSLLAVGIIAISVYFVVSGHNTLYTYIAPWSISVADVPPDLVSAVLLAFGIAALGGVLIAGALGDRYPRLTVNGMTAAVVALLLLITLLGSTFAAVPLLVLWSLAFGGLPALFHARALHGSSRRVRTISGSIVTTAFNFAIATGALVGGGVLDGAGVATIPWVAAAIVAAGLVVMLATDRARIAAHPAEAHRG
ncbi:MAG: MFS transporter [Gemmatimonadetes bacterium]|nr:MFS transporter [Gemmatimonadota bacterium]